MTTPAPLPSTVPIFGYLVPWVASTVYPLGVRVTNVGNIYQVATQGTSGNAGGPIGMAAGEADPGSPDGLTWNFIAASAVAWAPSTAYLKGAAVSNDGGRLYQCIAGGVSAGSGGPTGAPTNPNVITDGTVTWTYIAIVGAQITVPTSRTQDLGPTPGSPLFSQYIAWFFSLVTTWIYYVRDLAGQSWTWTGPNVFTQSISFPRNRWINAQDFNSTIAAGGAATWTTIGNIPGIVAGANGSNPAFIALDLAQGETIVSIDIRYLQIGAGQVTGALKYFTGLTTATGAPTQASLNVFTSSVTPGEKVSNYIPTGAPITVGADRLYYFEFSSAAIGDTFYGIRVNLL